MLGKTISVTALMLLAALAGSAQGSDTAAESTQNPEVALHGPPAISGEAAADNRRAAGGSVSKRFSFGIMAGASLAPARTGSTTSTTSVAEFGQPPPLPPLMVTSTSTEHVRHGSVSPLASAFAALRLGRGFSLQAGLSYRLLPTTVTYEVEYGEPAEQYSGTFYRESPRGFLEVPTIVTYRFETAPRRPFVGFGPTFRVLRERWHEPRYGVVAACGFDLFRSRRWDLTTQVRYTRWAAGVAHPESAPRARVQALLAVVF